MEEGTCNVVCFNLLKHIESLLEESGSLRLDFRAVFRNQGQYGLQLGVLVFDTPSEARMVAAAIDGKDYNGDSMCFNELKHTTLHVPSSILDTHTRTRG